MSRSRTARGQSLVVAVIVLFLLLFLGGVFIALVARNLSNTQRQSNVSSSNGFADAGLRYLDEQLVKSPEGADWRPVPDSALPTALIPNPAEVAQADPDYFWLKRYDPATGEGGFTRVTFGGPTPSRGNAGGRALVRITYRPDRPGTSATSANPNSKYLKLEAVGRVGFVGAVNGITDPTTFGNSERAGLRRELVAYKDISLVNYVRYITNKDNKPGTAPLGAPFPVYDRPGNGTNGLAEAREIPSFYFGPVRADTGLTFYGENYFALQPDRNDALEVAGQIVLDKIAPGAATVGELSGPGLGKVFVARVDPATNTFPAAPNVFPSTSGAFTTLDGLVRDNANAEDANRFPRRVARIAPPVIDAPTGPRGLTRYRANTRDSAPMATRFTNAADNPRQDDFAGRTGWGEGMYIANRADVQRESENLIGAKSLRGEWLNPDPATTANWLGDYTYDPPGVTITLTPRYMKITAFTVKDGTTRRPTYEFRRPDGSRISGQTTIIRYTDDANTPLGVPKAGIATGTPIFQGYPARKNRDGIDGNRDDTYFIGDFVIFAEGNIRIRGCLGGVDAEAQQAFVRHLTVVSNATIYIDGNLLKDNVTPGMSIPGGATEADIRGKSSLALLARDYVCVNTTQFLRPAPISGPTENESNVTPTRELGPGATFDFAAMFGPVDDPLDDLGTVASFWATGAPIGANVPPTTTGLYADAALTASDPVFGPDVTTVSLFVRHTIRTRQGQVNLFVNDKDTVGTRAEYDFAPPSNTFSLLVPSVPVPPPTPENPAQADIYSNQLFRLQEGAQNAALLFPANQNPIPVPSALGIDNTLHLRNDPSTTGSAAGGTYNLTRVGIAPLDIRIEAFMYAQEGSFFIIPGPWFNPDPNDTYANYRVGLPGGSVPLPSGSKLINQRLSSTPLVDPRFPFHREPMDIRITFHGAITENLPAQIGDQGAWLEKWGWVPRFHGAMGLPETAPDGTTRDLPVRRTSHGPQGNLAGPKGNLATGTNDVASGGGLLYVFDARGLAPYDNAGAPIRPNPYQPNDPLPITPRLPLAPGLLFVGENPVR